MKRIIFAFLISLLCISTPTESYGKPPRGNESTEQKKEEKDGKENKKQEKNISNESSSSVGSLLELTDEIVNLKMQLNEKDDSIRKLHKEKDQAIKDALREKEVEIQKKEDEIKNKQSEINGKHEEIKELQATIANADEQLRKSALFYLIIPYNEPGITRVAIPTFKAINSEKMKAEHNAALVLLENYAKHANELKVFLTDADKIFDVSNNLLKTNAAKDIQESYSKLLVVPEYKKYRLWDSTYLGKFIKKVDQTVMGLGRATPNDTFKKLLEEFESLNIK